jgi:hypothetical protein
VPTIADFDVLADTLDLLDAEVAEMLVSETRTVPLLAGPTATPSYRSASPTRHST